MVEFANIHGKRGPRKPKKLPVWIEPREYDELIKYTRKDKHKLAFLLGYGAGMRVSEICKLEPRNVNLNDKTIKIEQGKGSKDRVVPLPSGFKSKYISLLPLNISPRALQKAFIVNIRRAHLIEKKPSLHFHSLRHGFATNAISNGIPLNHVQMLLGHTSASTTAIYLQSNPIDALKSYQELFWKKH